MRAKTSVTGEEPPVLLHGSLKSRQGIRSHFPPLCYNESCRLQVYGIIGTTGLPGSMIVSSATLAVSYLAIRQRNLHTEVQECGNAGFEGEAGYKNTRTALRWIVHACLSNGAV